MEKLGLVVVTVTTVRVITIVCVGNLRLRGLTPHLVPQEEVGSWVRMGLPICHCLSVERTEQAEAELKAQPQLDLLRTCIRRCLPSS